MRISILGMWHLGCVTAGCVAEAGHEVTAIDTNPDVVADLDKGVPPLFEPGLAELLKQDQSAGRLRFTTDLSAIAETDVLWVCHDTPVGDEDRADVAHVAGEVRATFPYLRDGAVVLVSAQLPVGTISSLEKDFAEVAKGRTVSFACSPENLRLGKALEVFRNPGRIVIGVRDERTRQVLEPLLSVICDQLIWTSVESAEMTKHALNAFLAVCVTFINEIAAICEKVGADAHDVERALRTDPRVGPNAYVRPGPAFAGGTLARDIQFLSGIAQSTHVEAPLIEHVIPSNRAHRKWAINQLRDRLGSLKDRRIAVLGLAYKPGTSSMRRSTAVELLRDLVADGADIRAFDPAVQELPSELKDDVQLSAGIPDALADAQGVVIATEWPEFRELGEADFAATSENCVLLDPARFLASGLSEAQRVKVVSIGTPL